MNHYREPIPHTCPEINKVIDAINRIEKLSNSRIVDGVEELRDRLSDIENEVYGLDKSLESLRKSNDELRAWGISEAERVDELEERLNLNN